MTTLATSVVFGVLNLLLTGCALIFAYTSLADMAIVIEMVLLPLLVLATVVFAVRDFLRRATRLGWCCRSHCVEATERTTAECEAARLRRLAHD